MIAIVRVNHKEPHWDNFAAFSTKILGRRDPSTTATRAELPMTASGKVLRQHLHDRTGSPTKEACADLVAFHGKAGRLRGRERLSRLRLHLRYERAK